MNKQKAEGVGRNGPENESSESGVGGKLRKIINGFGNYRQLAVSMLTLLSLAMPATARAEDGCKFGRYGIGGEVGWRNLYHTKNCMRFVDLVPSGQIDFLLRFYDIGDVEEVWRHLTWSMGMQFNPLAIVGAFRDEMISAGIGPHVEIDGVGKGNKFAGWDIGVEARLRIWKVVMETMYMNGDQWDAGVGLDYEGWQVGVKYKRDRMFVLERVALERAQDELSDLNPGAVKDFVKFYVDIALGNGFFVGADFEVATEESPSFGLNARAGWRFGAGKPDCGNGSSNSGGVGRGADVARSGGTRDVLRQNSRQFTPPLRAQRGGRGF